MNSTTPQILPSAKQPARSVTRSLGVMVATDWHLWLLGIQKHQNNILPDAPVSPYGLFREAKVQTVAFEHYIPH